MMRMFAGDRWIPIALGAGFCLMLSLSVALAVIAVRSDPGLVAGSPMRLAGTQVLPAAAVPALDLQVVARGAEGVVVLARLRDPDGRPLVAGSVIGNLGRPTHAGDDRAVLFAPRADGTWEATLTLPSGGVWDLSVQAQAELGAAAATLRL